ncbi:UDP-N-acetylmuramoyl-tripeptide--D-alanyl-D-alanine ligase [Methylobacillus flagellatus]|uniref:UDP-N-acetylmuramoyl-tripeptide--D-alanyl-D-alanine ligase n=1 Tax=Methylobacillus flagellatus (strain ATCC 51484 / DSM 6875 / VKM B-1610 / KT) TaxID=265072 RepID=Q1GYZ7_METFK|nr:UDP-N-acetylmuramoyl-tripeptide--D-alanyl-D-alanine ligase [Methylobacillus flagellatus]ABE50540.1 UDP-N-acetylmuramoyl-tripeptide--D-alanyl-D-alanine ligase [Methylobacillus flagellatus KT]
MMYLSEIAKATGGTLVGQDVLIQSVGTDSRKLEPAQLFVALKGERFDGHDYARAVLSEGATAVLLSHDVGATPAVLVEDTRLALGQLAAYWRSKFSIPVAAITGSNGKTSVKEMLAAILRVAAGADDAVLATQGNLNNDIGLPLTLLRLHERHRYAVVEMGMNHAGEISYLTRIGRPDVALINNATAAHLGGLGSVEGVAKAKGEIFEGLADDGVAVINADDSFAGLWQSLAGRRRIVRFGLNAGDVTAGYALHSAGCDLQLSTPAGERALHLPVPGLHNIRNALAATAVALSMGVSLDAVAEGLAGFAGVKGRLQRKPGRHGALLIDDTYNANPASMRAAIDVLASHSGKRLLVVGDMGELGENEAALHAELGAYAKAAGVDALHALGRLSAGAVEAYGPGASHHETVEGLAAALLPALDADTTVLVKGSRFMRMERVIDLLQDQKEKPSCC